MIEIRKGRTEEMQEIVSVANSAFAPIREDGFDFRNIMPKAYGNRDTSSLHFILKEDGKILSVVGNMPSQIRAGETLYPFSLLGSVSTLPAYQGRGYMNRLMRCAEEEDLQKGVVFSALTGYRGRYRNYGYEKCSTRYRFGVSRYFSDRRAHNADVSVLPYREELFDQLYCIFLASNPLVMRKKQDFIDCLHTGDTLIKVVLSKGTAVGYYALSTRKDCIMELALNDIALLPDAVKSIMDAEGAAYLNFQINPLDFSLVEAMDQIAEEKCLTDYLHIKVYDMAKFLELVIKLNLPRLPARAFSECYRIDGQNYQIEVEGGAVAVKKTTAGVTLKDYSAQEFLRKAIGLGDNDLCRTSTLFPLQFGLSEPDLF